MSPSLWLTLTKATTSLLGLTDPETTPPPLWLTARQIPPQWLTDPEAMPFPLGLTSMRTRKPRLLQLTEKLCPAYLNWHTQKSPTVAYEHRSHASFTVTDKYTRRTFFFCCRKAQKPRLLHCGKTLSRSFRHAANQLCSLEALKCKYHPDFVPLSPAVCARVRACSRSCFRSIIVVLCSLIWKSARFP